MGLRLGRFTRFETSRDPDSVSLTRPSFGVTTDITAATLYSLNGAAFGDPSPHKFLRQKLKMKMSLRWPSPPHAKPSRGVDLTLETIKR